MTHRRPLQIRLIALAYVVSPLFNVLQAMVLWHDLSWNGFVQYVGNSGLGVSLALLLAAPVVGVGIYAGRRWGYALFLTHALLALVHNGRYLGTAYGSAAAPYVAIDVVMFALVLYMMRHDQRAPYLAQTARGWRSSERFDCTLPLQLVVGDAAPVHGLTTNVSCTGALVSIDTKAARVGDMVELILGSHGHEMRVKAFIVWISEPTGTLGAQFMGLSEAQESQILDLASATKPSVSTEASATVSSLR